MDTTLPSYLVLLTSIFPLYLPLFALGNIEQTNLDELIRLQEVQIGLAIAFIAVSLFLYFV